MAPWPDVRGLAYLVARRSADAAQEFQKILDHPGMVAGDPIGTQARLQLGRALCQGKVEMSPRWQSKNVPFCPGLSGT